MNSVYLLDAGGTTMNCNSKIWLNSNKYSSLLCRPVSGQFGAGQFGADNSAQDNSARTIRRDNSSRTIRRKVYNYKFYRKFRYLSAIFSHIPLPFQQYFFINPASISTVFFINPDSILAIFFINTASFSALFSSIPLLFQ